MDLCLLLMTCNGKNKVSRFATKHGALNYHVIEIRLKGDVNQVAWELSLPKGCGRETPSSLLSIHIEEIALLQSAIRHSGSCLIMAAKAEVEDFMRVKKDSVVRGKGISV